MDIYTTCQGDTWDMISYKCYGIEKHIGILMQENFDLLDIFIFPQGIEVLIPELDEEDTTDIPEWRD